MPWATRPLPATDPAGIGWSWHYDQRGRQDSSTDPDKGTVNATFDNAGQLLTTTDARNVVLAHAYDELGRKTSTWKNAVGTGTKLAEWTFDTATDGAGIAGHGMYGFAASSTRWMTGNAYTTAVSGYDAANRPTGTTVTIPAIQTGLAGSYAFTTTYNNNGSVATQTMPAAGGLAAETLVEASVVRFERAPVR